jgi:hypothetical protein
MATDAETLLARQLAAAINTKASAIRAATDSLRKQEDDLNALEMQFDTLMLSLAGIDGVDIDRTNRRTDASMGTSAR